MYVIFNIKSELMNLIIKSILRPLELYTLFLAFIFTDLFDINFDLANVDETPIKSLLGNLHSILNLLINTNEPLGALILIIQFILIIWVAFGKEARLATDVLAIYLSFCWVLELICMNLLLVSPILNPVFMLTELLLFIPIILIGFSWWYWRINHKSRIGLGKEAISFDEPPTFMSYFIKTACVAVNDTTEHGVCQTDTAKLIRILNGFVVMDVFGLTLTRAIGLIVL